MAEQQSVTPINQWKGICPGVGNTMGRDNIVQVAKMMRRDMSGWQNNGRNLSGVAKMTGGGMSGRGFVHTPTPIHPLSHFVFGGYNDIFCSNRFI